MTEDPSKRSILKQLFPFVFAAIGGCTATSCIQPFDTIKVRIQIINEDKGQKIDGKSSLRSTNPLSVGREIIANEGFKGFYKGIDAALLRQVIYGTIRMGLYKTMSNWQEAEYKRNLYFYEKAFFSLFSGFVGCVIGNPADISLVRLQVDSLSPPEQRRNYTGVVNALTRIAKEEGILTFWRGSFPAVLRAMAMNFGMMASYDQIKEGIVRYTKEKESFATKSISSFLAGIVCAFVSLPFDNVKTKLMKMKTKPDGTKPYSGVADCFKQSVAREGLSGLWIGYETYIMRVGPHAIISLLTIDTLNSMFMGDNF